MGGKMGEINKKTISFFFLIQFSPMFLLEFWYALVIAGAVLIPLAIMTMDWKDRKWYNKNKEQVMLAPPAWLFPIAWAILYGLIIAAAILYETTIESDPTFVNLATYVPSVLYVATFSLMFVNLVLNLAWPVVFFKNREPAMAIAVAALLFLTAIAILALFGYQGNWLPFGLYFAYPMWLGYALALNINWVASVEPPSRMLAEYKKHR
jgi:tryptophan-rich sensory protein